MYCSIFPESYWLSKGKLIRLLVAQGLIQETAGKIMEDVAEEYICELINEQLLRVQDEHPRRDGTQLRVSCRLQKFYLDQLKEGQFAASEILNLVRLRHLKLFKNKGVSGMKLLAGIGRFADLLTLTDIHAGGGTAVEVGFSNLSENPSLVLQVLPNLKKLALWEAYNAKQIGKEFCTACGFSKLEVIIIASRILEEWTEFEEGALPSSTYLHLPSCLRLRMLPGGLQSLTTLQHLHLLPVLDDHAEQLKPDSGEEYYKIRHIPQISYTTNSMLQNYVKTGQRGTS
ncbi:hypothetical protein ACLB2K_052617 [Fragaria x ananassa]